jgi:uncharacterized protein with HEPN domain
MSKESIEYLKHILLECDYIVSVIKPETSKDEFLKDETVKRAVVRSLEIIGEATKKSLPILSSSGAIFHGKIWQECVTV